jgi:thiol-disulfide isomerase/thioredoxin
MHFQRPGHYSRLFLLGALALFGCSEEEKLELDPGASPFYPAKSGPTAKSPASAPATPPSAVAPDASPAPATTAPVTTDVPEPGKPLGPGDVEKQIRVAQRLVQRHDLEKAAPLLDQVLAVEPINREALNGRASIALQQAKDSLPLAERIAGVDAALKLVRKLRNAYDLPKKPELALTAAVLSRKAQLLLLEKKYDESVAILKEATDAGLDGLYWAEREPTMAELRSKPVFQSALSTMKAERVVAAKARIRDALDKPLPIPFDFKVKDLSGKPVALADFKGKVVLVDLWGTWCGPCREALPRIMEISRKFEPSGLAVVGLTYEKSDPADPQTVKNVQQFVKQSGIPYPIVMGDQTTLAQIPGFRGFPTTVIIDRDGKLRVLITENDERTLDIVEDAVTVLLAEKAGAK